MGVKFAVMYLIVSINVQVFEIEPPQSTANDDIGLEFMTYDYCGTAFDVLIVLMLTGHHLGTSSTVS